ncbi:uncharacterized protein UTRI_03631 [Ustilago trichophora]|uniref:Uncharacterized protein n=1 Tax=Ustilago trichophora TaxID=86804 RepID=A0A5C3E0X2_9BASI|nr:uncharacterized protein UTRI_03631 [Ustilago trichophora]
MCMKGLEDQKQLKLPEESIDCLGNRVAGWVLHCPEMCFVATCTRCHRHMVSHFTHALSIAVLLSRRGIAEIAPMALLVKYFALFLRYHSFFQRMQFPTHTVYHL